MSKRQKYGTHSKIIVENSLDALIDKKYAL